MSELQSLERDYDYRRRVGIPTIEEAYAKAALQLQKGERIGERKTPVWSTWLMREKWKRFGKWWTYIGSDGDVEARNGVMRFPMMLQLFYVVRPDGLVDQLCWERPDLHWTASRSVIGECFGYRI